MKTFEDVKAGDKLLKKGRQIYSDGKIIFQEWQELTIESVTRVYYIVDGKKYRKDSNGKEFMNNFYFPGQEGAPENATPTGEYEKMQEIIKRCGGLSFHKTGLERISNLEKRAELADKLRSVLKEIEDNL